MFFRQLFFLIVLLLPLTVFAQESVIISGRVTAKVSGESLSGVVVSIRQAGTTKTTKFCRTSEDGYYKLQFTAMPENSVIHFSMMGFAVVDVPIVVNQYQYNVKLEERETILKEVVIKAPNIRQRGDTVMFNVSSFSSVSDKSLADVLKKMPGIDVSENGEIKYNGVEINKFYIEGHDMLGGRYGLATNNIHHDDVGMVEVIQNHQPIKALEDISFSQNPAINIRLKESAKMRLVGTMNIGGGVNPGLWKDELTLMRFARKLQTLNVLKTNNTGDNILKESNMLFFDDMTSLFPKSYKMKDFINVLPDRLTDLDKERVRRNQSQNININNLWVISKNSDLSTVLSYGHERLFSDSRSSTSYLLPDSTIIIEEDEAAKTHHHELAADISYMSNTDSYYLQNKLTANFDWNTTDIRMNGTTPNFQTASTPHYKVADNFELLKRSKQKTYTLNSYNTYQSAPHRLIVDREGRPSAQTIRSISLYSHTSTALGFSFKPVTIWAKTGIIAMSRTLKSEASGIPNILGQISNRASVNYLNLYVSPEIEYKSDIFNAKLEVPIAIAPYSYMNQLTTIRESCAKFLVSPRLYLQFYFTSNLSLALSGQTSQKAVAEQSFYEGVIMNDYRRLSLGLVDFDTDLYKSFSLNLAYKRPLQSFYANITAVRSFTDYELISSRTYTHDYILSSSISQKHSGRLWMVNGNIAKGIDLLKGLLSISPSYFYSDGQMYQNGILSPYASRSWLLTARVKSEIRPMGDVSYEIVYGKEEMQLKNTGQESSANSFSHHFTAHVNFSKQLFVTVKGDYYDNQVSENERKYLFLGDASISYSLKNGWELTLEARNIFNKKTYTYTSYSNLITYNKEYTIRPRNVIVSIFLHF